MYLFWNGFPVLTINLYATKMRIVYTVLHVDDRSKHVFFAKREKYMNTLFAIDNTYIFVTVRALRLKYTRGIV